MKNMSNHRSIEILLIEDSPSDANLIIKYLEKNYTSNHIYWVDDGERAIEYLQKQGNYTDVCHPDLILLDLNLPKVDGREILTFIKSDPQLKLIPVIILTTSELEQDILLSYKLHANCYITKPIDIKEFTRIIQLISDFWMKTVQLLPTVR
jgi:two-component system, chemotaxis family, response regulator Rcp1